MMVLGRMLMKLSESFMAKVATPHLQGSFDTDTLNHSIMPHLYVPLCTEYSSGSQKVSLTHSAL